MPQLLLICAMDTHTRVGVDVRHKQHWQEEGAAEEIRRVQRAVR